jgi:molybdate-binding protein
VHAAVVHGLPTELPQPPIPVVRWHLARWQVGLAVSPNIRGDSVQAVLRGGIPVAQRDPAAASQQAFERATAKAGIAARPLGPQATGHIDAARIAATVNGAAVTTEAAAHAFGLRFLALEDHTVEIWLAERWIDHPGINALADLLATTAFTERVGQFGGYDLDDCGSPVPTTEPS